MEGADVVTPSSSLSAYASVSPAGPTTHPQEHTKIKVSPLTDLDEDLIPLDLLEFIDKLFFSTVSLYLFDTFG